MKILIFSLQFFCRTLTAAKKQKKNVIFMKKQDIESPTLWRNVKLFLYYICKKSLQLVYAKNETDFIILLATLLSPFLNYI